MREVRASGTAGLRLATELLQRARLADPYAGIWEAADVQWWSRRARLSDDVEQVFWDDCHGPVAGVVLTSWSDDRWQCDQILVPHQSSIDADEVWARAREQIDAHVVGTLEVPVRDDDVAFRTLVEAAGLVADERSSIAWMDAADRPAAEVPAEGFVLVDRAMPHRRPHPMSQRNGDQVEERLSACSLYEAELDIAVETADGQPAGYVLCWYDPVTRVGLVEPVRVEDEFQRLGLARAMLTEGLDRLAAKGAERLKIGYGTEAAGTLYRSLGFRPTSPDGLVAYTRPA